MRRLMFAIGTIVLAVTILARPAQAETPSAGGSCGFAPGSYGLTDVNSNQVNDAGDTVTKLYFAMNYSGVPAPTSVGIFVRYNDELENQIGFFSFIAQNPSGTYEASFQANISPSSQGYANSLPGGTRGRADGPPSGGVKFTQNSPTQAGLLPGEYVFYVYTGEVRNIIRDPKDSYGPQPTFVADEKGFLGRFTCGVSTSEGSGPG